MNPVDHWRELGLQLRVDSVRACSAAESGHPTSSMSAADLIAVLVGGQADVGGDEAQLQKH